MPSAGLSSVSKFTLLDSQGLCGWLHREAACYTAPVKRIPCGWDFHKRTVLVTLAVTEVSGSFISLGAARPTLSTLENPIL